MYVVDIVISMIIFGRVIVFYTTIKLFSSSLVSYLYFHLLSALKMV